MTDSSFLSFITASPGDRKTSLQMVVAEKQDEMFRVLGKIPSEVRNKALGCWYDLREYIDSEMDSPEIKTVQSDTQTQTAKWTD
jgi:nucleoside-triphosphatase THEP1